jgi:ABC-2 type transport system ATP-binding protein
MSEEVAVKVEAVSKAFKLPHERQNSVKSALINFRKRKKGYEKQQVLKNISFEIYKGEFFAIVGRNGSGKSTLLKLLAGIYSPDEGSITINGKIIPFIELGVGFNPELSGRENVYLNGALLGFSRPEVVAMYDDIVAFAELERFMDQKLKNYSSGMQVRLAFSIAIRAQGGILLLDEVLAVGDAAFQQKCFDYFEQLKRDKKTVILVSHDMGVIRRFCSRAIYLEKGKIIQEGTPIDIADTYQKANIAQTKTDDAKPQKKLENIKVRIIENKPKRLTFEIKYTNNARFKAYVGFSLLKDGATFAEVNSLGHESDAEKAALTFTIDTSQFNPGIYEISAALIKFDNKELVLVTDQRARFVIDGYSNTRGGAINLPDTWVYKET